MIYPRHEPPLNPPEPEPSALGCCDECGEPIGGSAWHTPDGMTYCEDCAREIIRDMELDELAEAIGWRKEAEP